MKKRGDNFAETTISRQFVNMLLLSIIIIYFSSYAGKAEDLVTNVSSNKIFNFVIPRPLTTLDLHFTFLQELPLSTMQPTIGTTPPPITTYHPLLDKRNLTRPYESSANLHNSFMPNGELEFNETDPSLSFKIPQHEEEINEMHNFSTTSENVNHDNNNTIEYPSTSTEPTIHQQDNDTTRYISTSTNRFYIYPGFHNGNDPMNSPSKPTEYPVNHIQGDESIYSFSTTTERTYDEQLVIDLPSGLLKIPQDNQAIIVDPLKTSITNTTTIAPLPEEDPDSWLTEEPENIAFPEFYQVNTDADADFIGYEVPCGIGKISNSDDERIVNGSDALIGEFPWMVSIQLKSGLSWRHICGGVVISRDYIITAGHCVHKLPLHSLSVVAGDHSLYIHEGHEQRRSVVRAQARKGFVKDNFKEDIAILQLDPYLKLDGTWVAPICLPSPTQQLPPVSRAIVAGWGRLSEGGTLPQILQKVNLPIISKSRCNTLYEQNGFKSFLHPCQICSGWEEGGSDSCQGDSGGPLACKDENGRYFLCGVVSWGIGCARPKFPGVYTQVSCYSQWISNVLYNKASVSRQTIDIAS